MAGAFVMGNVSCNGRAPPARQKHVEPYNTMKLIHSILTSIALLPITGCVFPGNRDHSDIQSRPGHEHHEEYRTIAEHKEYPVNPLSALPASIPKHHASHGR